MSRRRHPSATVCQRQLSLVPRRSDLLNERRWRSHVSTQTTLNSPAVAAGSSAVVRVGRHIMQLRRGIDWVSMTRSWNCVNWLLAKTPRSVPTCMLIIHIWRSDGPLCHDDYESWHSSWQVVAHALWIVSSILRANILTANPLLFGCPWLHLFWNYLFGCPWLHLFWNYTKFKLHTFHSTMYHGFHFAHARQRFVHNLRRWYIGRDLNLWPTPLLPVQFISNLPV